jgi:hypothetical protein
MNPATRLLPQEEELSRLHGFAMQEITVNAGYVEPAVGSSQIKARYFDPFRCDGRPMANPEGGGQLQAKGKHLEAGTI